MHLRLPAFLSVALQVLAQEADVTTREVLRRELNVRQEEVRARLDSLGPCPECGAAMRSVETSVVETFRSAPKWQAWPGPPPPEYEQIGGHRWEIKLTCENGHEMVRKDIRFKDEVKS